MLKHMERGLQNEIYKNGVFSLITLFFENLI